MSKIVFRAILTAAGGVYYALLEVLWRGRTHWSMIAVGGIAFLIMYIIFDESFAHPFFLKCIYCAAAITAVEFVFGCAVNIGLGLGVWDYSGMRFNLLGQICPLFSAFWLILSLAGARICKIIRKLERLFREKNKAKGSNGVVPK